MVGWVELPASGKLPRVGEEEGADWTGIPHLCPLPFPFWAPGTGRDNHSSSNRGSARPKAHAKEAGNPEGRRARVCRWEGPAPPRPALPLSSPCPAPGRPRLPSLDFQLLGRKRAVLVSEAVFWGSPSLVTRRTVMRLRHRIHQGEGHSGHALSSIVLPLRGSGVRFPELSRSSHSLWDLSSKASSPETWTSSRGLPALWNRIPPRAPLPWAFMGSSPAHEGGSSVLLPARAPLQAAPRSPHCLGPALRGWAGSSSSLLLSLPRFTSLLCWRRLTSDPRFPLRSASWPRS